MAKSGTALCAMLLGGSLLAASAGVHADERQISLDWLKVIAFAAHQLNYSGEFIYQHDNRVETSRITHVVEGDNEFEKLERLDGPKFEIIRYNGQVWCDAGQNLLKMDSRQVRGSFPTLLPEQLSALSANYRARNAGVERVAGYNTQALLFQPRDNLRYTHKIWAHTDSGLLLKAAVIDDRNQLVEQYAFTQLRIGGDIDRSWVNEQIASGTSGKGDPAFEASQNATSVNSGWVADALPPGFTKIRELLRPMRGRQNHVTQIVYSDGMSAISVFIESMDGNQAEKIGLTSHGAVSLYRKQIDGRLITVVGEVPPHTVMQVLNSIRNSGK